MLRPYQIKLIDTARGILKQGVNRLIIQLATGGG